MSNINKILIVIVACVFMICVASVSIVSIVTSQNSVSDTTTSVAPEQTQSPESTTSAPVTSAPVQSTSPTSSESVQTTVPTTSAPSQSSDYTPSGNLAQDILGSWTDSAGMSGYEFLEGGKLNWTYFDLVQFGVPLDGKTAGLYTLEGDTLTVKFSIYSATIKKSYRISISENELSMYDLEEHETATYVRVS